jgi:hypothetical protein
MFQNLDFNSRYDVGAFLRPLGKAYYVYMLMQGDMPFYIGTSCNWKRVYGHFSENEDRVNFLVKSKIKRMQEDNEIVVIRLHQQYETAEEMYVEEIRLISLYGKRIDNNGGILTNLSDGGEGRAGLGTSEKQKEAVRKANTGKPKTQETLRKLSESLIKSYKSRDGTFKGKKHTEETKRLMSQMHTGVNHPQYGMGGETHWNFGKQRTEETKSKIKLAQSLLDMSCTDERKQKLKDYWLNQPLLVCPHCGKQSTFKPAMVRFHFDNCKVKEIDGC